MTKTFLLVLGTIILLASGCKKNSESTTTSNDISETGQQIADVTASIDESGGSSGNIGSASVGQSNQVIPNSEIIGGLKTLARVFPEEQIDGDVILNREKVGIFGLCSGSEQFSSCTSNVITRTFGGCNIGSATIDGSVTLTFSDVASDNTCQMTTSGHYVRRVPSFTMTGPRGGTLTVSKTGTNGQQITRGTSATSLTFSNDGIRRVIQKSGTTLYDFTTETTSSITITGANRSGRVLNGGTLKVTNNSTSGTCSMSPTNVTWASSCNCPTSGTWDGTCSDGTTSKLEYSGCGTGTLTIGSDSNSVTFDRCYSL